MVEVNQLLEQERVASEMLGEEKRAHASVLSELERVSSVSLWRVCVCVACTCVELYLHNGMSPLSLSSLSLFLSLLPLSLSFFCRNWRT